MTSISILPVTDATGKRHYQAVSGATRSIGQTPGQALDAIAQTLDPEGCSIFLLIPNFQPDRFFTAAQQQRLETLMTEWRHARDTDQAFPPDLQAELDALVEAELMASTQRLSANLSNFNA
ncbi:MAG: hypothetical protein B0A82_00030 [Alkalinema sp. CACIAM 70d]|nr:MAG: hypothetical protein B0A82_00030 [Alkalinema sp. CACIAM 70d]